MILIQLQYRKSLPVEITARIKIDDTIQLILHLFNVGIKFSSYLSGYLEETQPDDL